MGWTVRTSIPDRDKRVISPLKVVSPLKYQDVLGPPSLRVNGYWWLFLGCRVAGSCVFKKA